MRGSQEQKEQSISCSGIIPAGAGLTNAVYSFNRWDEGSSPRVRGSRVEHHLEEVGSGIIPAGAGLTSSTTSATSVKWDHPRGCGAHALNVVEETKQQGSSPRVRGSPEGVGVAVLRAGIIPAGAGLTL